MGIDALMVPVVDVEAEAPGSYVFCSRSPKKYMAEPRFECQPRSCALNLPALLLLS